MSFFVSKSFVYVQILELSHSLFSHTLRSMAGKNLLLPKMFSLICLTDLMS